MRRLRVLMTGLPSDCAFAVALGAPAPGWGNTEELLALVAELVDMNTRAFIQANSKKGSKPPKPLVIKRPSRDEPKPKRQATAQEAMSWFGAPRNAPKGLGPGDGDLGGNGGRETGTGATSAGTVDT